MPRNNILLRRLPVLKKATLPNGRTFYAKYVRLSTGNLPPNVRIARTYVQKIGPKRQRKHRAQRGKGLLIPPQAVLSVALDMGKRAGNNELGQMIIKNAIDFIPTAYTKIKNKLFKRKENRAVVAVVVAVELLTLIHILTKIFVNVSVGISNLGIEKIFKNIRNDDLNEHFLCFPFK